MDVERHVIQILLRTGLLISMLFMAAGAILRVQEGSLDSQGVTLNDLFNFRSGVLLGDRWMAYGILLLAMTPVIRVLALFGLWTYDKDWKFTAVAFVVLVTLAMAISMGGG
jgi:uncharacterized membrane protein